MIQKFHFSQYDINSRVSNINPYKDTILYIGQQLNVDHNLLKAIIAVESSGNAKAGAGRTTGAKGLMQVIKVTWESTINHFPNLNYKGTPLKSYLNRDSNEVWADPGLNVLIGTLTLILKARSLTKMTGINITAEDPKDAAMLLTAYNAGEYTVMKAVKRAIAAGSRNPQMDFLQKQHLQGAINDVVTRFNLRWNVPAKYKEISEYAGKVLTFLDMFKGTNSFPKTSNPIVHNSTTTTVIKEEHNPKNAQYTIVHGDTGYRIARKLGVSFSQLSKANPSINWGRLSLGQKLNIPGSSNFKEIKEPKPEAPKKEQKYRVQRGETLGIIARKFRCSVWALKAANRNQLKRWGSVEGFEAGAVITIPAS